jgi:hypothetical protein
MGSELVSCALFLVYASCSICYLRIKNEEEYNTDCSHATRLQVGGYIANSCDLDIILALHQSSACAPTSSTNLTYQAERTQHRTPSRITLPPEAPNYQQHKRIKCPTTGLRHLLARLNPPQSERVFSFRRQMLPAHTTERQEPRKPRTVSC